MTDNVYLFNAKIYKFGTDILLEECQIMAYNLFQANHILVDYIYDDTRFKIPVEIGELSKIRQVTNIINPEFILDSTDDNVFTGDIPLEVAKKLPEDQVISFPCQCHETLRVPAGMGFPFVTCPNCELEIKPSEIKSAGGIFYYSKSSGDKK